MRRSTSSTMFGLEERWVRTLIYPIILVVGLFVPFSWLIVWALAIALFFVERNRNVRWHTAQALAVFGPLSILHALVQLLQALLGHIFFLGFFLSLALGFVALVIFWVMVILAIWLAVMAWFRPTYSLPFVGNYIRRWV